MRKLNRLLMAALVLTVPLAACDEGDDTITPEPTPPAVGTVTGTVTVQGEGGIPGVTVQLAGAASASTTTGSDGSFSFADVVEGNYSVAISNIPADFTFQNTVQTVTINTDGQTQSVAFSGSVVRTASLSGAVTVNGQAFPGVNVEIAGPEGSESTSTGAAGEYQFTGLRSGAYTVTVTNPDPDTYTFNTPQSTVNLSVGESAVTNFAATQETVLPPAEISINAITQGGSPITLSNVMGQIEVALNIRRNENTLDRVEVLVRNEVVAEQQFADLAIDGPAQQDDVEVVTLNVPTDQVRMNGDIATPVLFNGGAEVSALLYVVGDAAPVPSNEVPIVLNNPDYVVAADLMYVPVDDDTGAQDVNGDTWFSGNTQFTADFFLPFSGVQPEWIEFDESGSCAFDEDESTVTGGLATGWTVSSAYACDTAEGATEIENDIEDWSYGEVLEGPDGTDLRIGGSMARLGAEFMLDGETRRFLRTPGDDPLIVTLPDELLIDNVEPSIFIFGELADDPATAAATDLEVAFNTRFDQWWTQSTFPFETVVSGPDTLGTPMTPEPLVVGEETDPSTADGGVGLASFEVRVFDADAGTCTGDAITRVEYVDLVAGTPTNPTALDETVTSEATGDPTTAGVTLCVIGTDLLGNSTAEDAADESNYFGVDDTAPLIFLAGSVDFRDAGDAIVAATEIDPFEDAAIFNIAGDGEGAQVDAGGEDFTTVEWGVEAFDDRAGFVEPGVTLAASDSFPVYHRLRHFLGDITEPNECGTLTDDLDTSAPLPGNFVRTPAADLAAYDCAFGDGYFTYYATVYDRAGNMAEPIEYEWLVDATAPAVASSVSFGQTLYTPGEAGAFTLFGSDDVEVIGAELDVVYPSIIGDLTLLYGEQVLDSRERFDGFGGLMDPFEPDLITESVTGGTATVPTLYGRFDFTCSGAGAPYAACAAADGVIPTAADSAQYNATSGGGTEAEDLLPTDVIARLTDAGFNAPDPLDDVTESFIPAQFTSSAAQQWAGEDIIAWRVVDDIDGNLVGEHRATTSIVEPYFDAAALVLNTGGVLTICEVVTTPTSADTGGQRVYSYTFTDFGDADATCVPPAADAAGTYHVVGFKGSAGLVSQVDPFTP